MQVSTHSIKGDKENQTVGDEEDGGMLKRSATDKFNSSDPI